MCPGALAVAATDQSDEASAFSNHGSRIDLAAPGQDIWSTWYASGLNLSTYSQRSGTSEAAPFVAGGAALIWTRWPALTPEGVKAQLLGTVDDVGQPGRDDETGWGRLDLAAAVAATAEPVDLRLAVAVSPQTVVAGNPLTATFSITNAGTTAATSVTIHASLPASPTIDETHGPQVSCERIGSELTCGMNQLDPGVSVVISVVVTPTVVDASELTTMGLVDAAQRELTPQDNLQTIKSAIRPVLWGRVFLDGNGDGIRQAWETHGVVDAQLFLEQDGLPIAFKTSQPPDGAYAFDTLPLGPYVLRAELPPSHQFTTPQDIALMIEPAQETVVFFGAWTGVTEPSPTPTPRPKLPLYLPLVVR
jgi:uncharacterized repeat protein (TIGR01451 family)